MGTLTKAAMLTVIKNDIIDRGDKDTLIGYALNWALTYIDKTAAARGFAFSDLNKEEITTTTISDTFEESDVTVGDDTIDVDIDIPTGTKIVFTAGSDDGDAVPAGLTASTEYWAIRTDEDTIQVAETYLEAWQGTEMTITDDGTGTTTITAYRERLAKPDECRYIYDIRLIDGAMSRKLIAMPPRRMDLFVPFAASCNQTRPTHYIEWKDWIQLYPIPDATYVIKIRYYKWTEFDASTTIADVDNIDDIIINAAAMHVWKILGEPEQAAIMEKAVEVSLAKCGKLERMKPDLVLKPSMGKVARADSDTVDDPFVFDQR